MNVIKKAVNEINPAAYNPRKDLKPGDAEYEKLKKSILEFDIVEPLIWNEKTGNLVGGHQRLKVIKELGIENVEVSVVNLSEVKEKALNIALNKISGEWDFPALKDLLEELDTGDIDIEITGFDLKEIEDLMTQYNVPEEGLTDDDAVPEQVEPVCKTGELWKLGDHRLLCGDATIITDVEKLMGGDKADMVFTDPPYGVGYDGGVKTKRERLVGDENTDLYEPCCKMACSFSVKEAPLYLWHAGVKGIAAAAAAAAAGYEIRCEIVWNKNQAQYGALSAQYKQKHEPCYYCFKKGVTVNWCGDTKQVTVWDLNRESKNEFHPTQKPVELAEKALFNHRAKYVLDLFGGSGSTLIACEKLNRRCYMMEIDQHYCDVIIKRWEDYTGKQAEVTDG